MAGRATSSRTSSSRSHPRRSSSSRRCSPARSTSPHRSRSRTSRSWQEPEVQGDAGQLLPELPRASSTRRGHLWTTSSCVGRSRTRSRTRTSSPSARSGYGTQARSAVPKGIFPYSATTPAVPRRTSPRRKALLARAGHKGGGFSLDLTYAAENQAEARFAPLIKDAFRKIGVTVNIKSMLFNQQWEVAKDDPSKAQDIFLLLYWPTYSDAGLGQPLVALPLEQEAFLQPQLLSEPRCTTSSSTAPASCSGRTRRRRKRCTRRR